MSRARRILTAGLALALVATSCSSDGDETAAPPASVAAKGSRTPLAPKGSRQLGEPAPIAIVHAIGDLADVPETIKTWASDVDVIFGDLATITTLDCTPDTDGCSTAALAATDGAIEVLSLASAPVAAADDAVVAELVLALEAAGVASIGYGADLDDALEPAVVSGDGHTVAFHAIALVADVDREATATTAGVAGPSAFDRLLEAIGRSVAEGYTTVVSVSWGDQAARAPAPDQVAIAEQLIAAGADAVVGNRPLHLQRLELIDDVPVVYALGDAVSGAAEPVERDTALFRLVLGSSGESACLLPATAGEAGPALDDPAAASCGA